ncbi:MAG: hypothetical protein VX112_01755 [Pseudomonadota bacterium]|nr:hypothetical protein [Pseudomonadota bacterium]
MTSIFIIAFISNAWTKNGGDWLNLTTIQDAYQQHHIENQFPSTQIETAIREPRDLISIIKEASNNPHNQYKLIFVSDHGAKAIRTLNDTPPPNVEVIWSGHQLVAEWEQLPVHKWYLPEHSIPTSDSEHLRNMVPLPGVITPGHKLSDHATNQERTTLPYTKEVIWMLSGDARKDQAGDSTSIDSWLLLKPDYSEKVVQVMTENRIFNDIQKVSIVNSPRTGQWEILNDSSFFSSSAHLGKTGYHSKPLNLESNIDPITQSAQKAVSTHLPDATVDIGHYWRQEPSHEGDAVIHHSNYQTKIDDFLQNPQALLLIPGDSVTDVSKVISTQHCINHRHNVFVILTDTMTPSIASWVERLYSQGYFGTMDVRSRRDPLLLPALDVNPEPKNILSEVKQSLDNSVTVSNSP